jgi:hypothetical protein
MDSTALANKLGAELLESLLEAGAPLEAIDTGGPLIPRSTVRAIADALKVEHVAREANRRGAQRKTLRKSSRKRVAAVAVGNGSYLPPLEPSTVSWAAALLAVLGMINGATDDADEFSECVHEALDKLAVKYLSSRAVEAQQHLIDMAQFLQGAPLRGVRGVTLH